MTLDIKGAGRMNVAGPDAMKRAFIIGALGVTTFGVVSCGAGTIVNHPSTPQGSTPTPSHAAASAAHVGATLTLNGTDPGEKLQITLVRVVDPAPPANQYEAPAAGMREIALELRYKNVGSATYNQSILTDVTVLDQAFHSYSIDIAGDTSAGPGFPSDEVNIAPGETADGLVTFQVPTGTPVSEVKVELDYGFGGDTGEWLVP